MSDQAAKIKSANHEEGKQAMSDPRETEHIECDCVPEIGPSHCHLCSVNLGHPVSWGEAEQLKEHQIANTDSTPTLGGTS